MPLLVGSRPIGALRVGTRRIGAAWLNGVPVWRGEDPDAARYLNTVEAVEGMALEPEIRQVVNDFVLNLKARQCWDRLTLLVPLSFVARTITGTMVPLIGPEQIPQGFTANDYTRTPDAATNQVAGLKGTRGVTQINSNIFVDASYLNDVCLAVFVTQGSYGGIYAGFTGGGMELYGNGAHVAQGTWRPSVNGLPLGLQGFNRSNANTYKVVSRNEIFDYAFVSRARAWDQLMIYTRTASSHTTDGTLGMYMFGRALPDHGGQSGLENLRDCVNIFAAQAQAALA